MTIDRRRLLATAGLGLAAPFFLKGASRAAEMALRLQHPLSASSNLHQSILVPWATAIRDASGGALLVQVIASPSQIATPLYDQAREGIIDIACTPAGSSGRRAPRLEVFELPFVGATRSVVNAQAINEYAGKHAAAEFPDVQFLMAWGQALGAVHANKPVATGRELQGMRLSSPTPMASRTLEALGAVAVSTRGDLIEEAFAQGVLDGGALPWEMLPSLRINAIANVHTIIPASPGLHATPHVLVMNKPKFAAMPEPLRRILLDRSGAVGAKAAGQALDDRDAEVAAIARSRGEAIIEVAADEKARWVAATEPLIAGWLASAGTNGLDSQALLAEARALLAKYEPPALELRGNNAPVGERPAVQPPASGPSPAPVANMPAPAPAAPVLPVQPVQPAAVP